MATHVGRNSKTFIGKLVVAWLLLASHVLAEEGQLVQAEDYKSFWLWAGVKPQAVLSQAHQVYILAGEVSGEPVAKIFSQRSATPRIKVAKVWIVYRAQTMAWDDTIIAEILRQMQVWKSNGNNLVGLQIDFDAGTKNLASYAVFLQKLRVAMPATYRLSITGLLDWSANGEPADLDQLAGIVDEVVLQIYQGRQVIPGYQHYLQKLHRLHVPFRIGLLQGGEWKSPVTLNDNPYFQGYVVFLLNET